jgi:enolase
MRTFRISNVRLRGVLDSGGRPAVEADVVLDGGHAGRASAARAIAPGRLEGARSGVERLGRLDDVRALGIVVHALEGCSFDGQADYDAHLDELPGIGTDVRVALSVAALRATAASLGDEVVDILAAFAGSTPRMPRPLVNIFSGGIHDDRRMMPVQQVMYAPDTGATDDNLLLAVDVFDTVERAVSESGPASYSASSGLLVQSRRLEDLLELLIETILRTGSPTRAPAIAIDVAAEHLRDAAMGYRWGSEHLTGAGLLERLVRLLDAYPIVYLEDPFDPDDRALWRTLLEGRVSTQALFGDDLFVSDADRLDPGLADGVVLKLTQAGTITRTLEAARRARELGMQLCVSHRSFETDDDFVADLAVALGAEFVKVGGPRRGDRTSKYNRLLRLAEAHESMVASAEEVRWT